MKMTVGDFKDMRGEDMPIILGNCKYVTGYGANETINGPWGWLVHTGDCDPMIDCNYMANDDMGFHFSFNGLDFVEVDTDNVEISSDGIYIDEPEIWVEPTYTVEACETSTYYIRKALGDGYDICKWGECDPIAWYPTIEDAEDKYNDLNGWND